MSPSDCRQVGSRPRCSWPSKVLLLREGLLLLLQGQPQGVLCLAYPSNRSNYQTTSPAFEVGDARTTTLESVVGHSDERLGSFKRHTRTLIGKFGKLPIPTLEEFELCNSNNYLHSINLKILVIMVGPKVVFFLLSITSTLRPPPPLPLKNQKIDLLCMPFKEEKTYKFRVFVGIFPFC